jgi:DNA-binding XRE family transcriptional regulator
VKNSSKNKGLDRIPKKYRASVEADLKAIALQIKKKRKAKKLTQEGLAELLEVDPSTIQAIEQSRHRPSVELLMTIIKALETKVVLQ